MSDPQPDVSRSRRPSGRDAKRAARTDDIIAKMASAHSKEAAEIWLLMGKLAKGTEAAQKETRELRDAIRELTADQKRTEAALRSFIQSLRGANGHRKRGVS